MAYKKEGPQPYAAMALFDSPEEILEAGRTVRDMGYKKIDALTPFPVHGMEDALGMPRSFLGYICIAAGTLGIITALTLQWWVGTINYPLVIGGKPLFAFEPSIPVTFELMVLFSSFAAVFGMLIINDLPSLFHPAFNYSKIKGATDDKFILVIEAKDPKFDRSGTARLLESLGGKYVEVVEDKDKDE